MDRIELHQQEKLPQHGNQIERRVIRVAEYSINLRETIGRAGGKAAAFTHITALRRPCYRTCRAISTTTEIEGITVLLAKSINIIEVAVNEHRPMPPYPESAAHMPFSSPMTARCER